MSITINKRELKAYIEIDKLKAENKILKEELESLLKLIAYTNSELLNAYSLSDIDKIKDKIMYINREILECQELWNR
tara:strand:- start:2994 stop:3224 length:231 start_codon:yes stop_codon:yes gene_type:complete